MAPTNTTSSQNMRQKLFVGMQTLKIQLKELFNFQYISKWLVISGIISVIIGLAVALFLFLLDQATLLQQNNPWLLYFIPAAGLLIYFLYRFSGKDTESGNKLILREIQHPTNGVPKRMAPLILITTLITHLFGGSAGREGTAVQMGGSLSNLITRYIKLNNEELKLLLMGGMAGGFGAVFGTPFTGLIFAIEINTIRKINLKAILPCLLTSFLSDLVCTSAGITHTQYAVQSLIAADSWQKYFQPDVFLLLKIIVAGIAFGLAAWLFITSSHYLKKALHTYIRIHWLLPVIGGLLIIALTNFLGTRDYLGLGVNSTTGNGVSIVNAFHEGGATYWSWLWKLVFTVITLSFGFKGGEVTPLFFIGATLGNTIALLLNAPVGFMAALGFIAVFAGATKTPFACTIMGIELFGPEFVVYYSIACFMAYFFSGKGSIYK